MSPVLDRRFSAPCGTSSIGSTERAESPFRRVRLAPEFVPVKRCWQKGMKEVPRGQRGFYPSARMVLTPDQKPRTAFPGLLNGNERTLLADSVTQDSLPPHPLRQRLNHGAGVGVNLVHPIRWRRRTGGAYLAAPYVTGMNTGRLRVRSARRCAADYSSMRGWLSTSATGILHCPSK